MRTVIIVPDGTGIRNFFCTRFIELLLSNGEVIVWHSLPDSSLRRFRERWGERVRWQHLPPLQDRLLEQLLRKARVYAQLYWQRKKGPVIQLKRLKRPPRWTTRMVEFAARLLGRILASPGRITWLDRWYQAAAGAAQHMPAYQRALDAFSPDVVFCLHQRGLQAVPAMLAAQHKGIPNATFIYSWDNLPKGRMPVLAENFFVWSERMKRELLGYYPGITPEQVHVTGTPQFEEYHNASLLQSREQFLGGLGLDPSKHVVCFSGDDVLTSPYDQIYLADLASALRSIPFPERPQILFRRSPVDRSARYDHVLADYPEIAVSDPLWKIESEGDWSQIIPQPEDSALLVNVVNHCDLVVNLGSTMAMDFAVYDKPGIFVAYNPVQREGEWDVEETYQLPHFASVHEMQPVYWARSPRELHELVVHALAFPAEKSHARNAWLHSLVRQPMDRASERFAAALVHLAFRHMRTDAGVTIPSRNAFQPSSI